MGIRANDFMTTFIYQQTIVQWRIPIKEDGKLGTPEIIKKFTTEWNGAQKKYTQTKEIKIFKPEQSEEVYI